ncbi:PREDICTED: pectinesterase-like [Ipomoea nil]|uniref:pectinesterase-like n=1 Tax=Ipomoea nil TaxID=35883 RepID=UPI0009015336|nr:PREDICTED: pectinesterase-like [Ipomoea nil]XP_019164579.1 PREDICTED: pectinesterase-like [Ipomoea nil]XP_019165088.1 PREDICTED: pectinesterase-like [Ipomoea nil]
MGSTQKNKKLGLLGIASILLLAFVVAATATATESCAEGDDKETCGATEIHATNKLSTHEVMKSAFSLQGLADVISKSDHIKHAVKSICQSTDFKELCEKSVAKANNSNDPKELIKAAFSVAWESIAGVISKSELIKRAEKDPMTSAALDVCKEVLDHSIVDFKRSIYVLDKSTHLNNRHGSDLRVWLTAAMTFQDTCLDAFENTTGDTGEKMKHLLKTSMELTSNALAIVSKLDDFIKSLEIPGLSRRLLEEPAPLKDDHGNPVDSTDEILSPFADPATRHLLAAPPKADIVVAQDGSGKYKSINAALNSIPAINNRRIVILIKAGVYKEYVMIPSKKNNIAFVGEGPTKTVITGNRNVEDKWPGGTYRCGTVIVEGEGFICRDLTIENSAGAVKHQAVALRISADMAAVYNCHLNAYQDTLYTHSYRQFYRDCTISGTVDFIFGNAPVVFQNCKMIVRKPMANQECMVTAQGRKDRRGAAAIVLQSCEILAEPALKAANPPIKVFLGRPWKEFSRTLIMFTFIDDIVVPEGWSIWQGTMYLDTCWYAEYQNRGPGASTDKRVKWKGYKRNISPEVAKQFTPGPFLMADEQWLGRAQIPFSPGFLQP